MVFTEAAAGMWEQPLPVAEEQHLAGAVPRRIREFRAGRHSARAGLARIGLRPELLLPAPGGGVRWPSGAVGSISHSGRYCAAAVAPAALAAGIGFDAAQRTTVTEVMARAVCRPEELDRCERDPYPAEERATLVFSAKEALYKALHPLTGVPLGFQDVTVTVPAARLTSGRFWARVLAPGPLSGLRVQGRYAFTATEVLTSVVLSHHPTTGKEPTR
ncbi:hypothetical protein AR457_14035 [Streptomyces agglomeratus]|uniref:4'-phosphopantetheinyl transferase family protein n=1 Tax=Streptomyces agglomeratus TaxID=285458 RepID=UPI00085434DA|nr:4'-phosphopantetheinyl transferase superfamily protein [Streptomyces agglomeratus]OEJ40554.1 hypothetical protein BGK70_22615 [Streptomyces agglomeratus]OEJ45066.1 hypothetical protein AR457_14035 [Streptomyces agglomeratus]